uniref:M_domain domain-containing protein n=1 Tax=Steinernema glaseri TaxID=37863 RepID=A0A1I7ZIV0_9BILA
MWGDETGAETMALNPWASVNQPQVWQNMNNRGNGNPAGNAPVGTFNGTVRPGSQQWDGANPAGRPAWNPHAPRWTPSVNHGNPSSWPVQPQHWNVPNTNGTYAEQTKKNMALNRNSGPNAMPQRFDGNQNWGSKVDQQTPWDTGNSGGVPQQMHDNKEWGAAARWSQGPAAWQAQLVPTLIGDWPQGQPRHDQWAGHPAPGLVPGPGGNWTQQAIGVASGSEPGRVPYDPNPQTPGPWVAPQPTEMNNDMMWHDPNPKQKKIQKDVGTAIWGDPSTQQEIRRWKELECEGESAGTNGSDWGSGSNSSTQPTGWGDLGAGGQCANDGTERWNAQPQNAPTGWEKGDQERASCDVSNANSEIIQVQRGGQNILVNGAALTADGQSRLQQWKKQKAIGAGSPDEKAVAPSSSESNVPSLIAATKSMSIHGEWTPPSSVVDTDTKSEDQVSSTGTNNEKEPSVRESASPTPSPTQIDDGPQEFVPGKKWEWRDPNKVAEDPNATPGNCKPNPLLAPGNNMNFAFSNSAVNAINPYGPEMAGGNPNYWQNVQGYPNIPYGRDVWNGRGRPHQNGQFMPPHRMMQHPPVGFPNNRMQAQMMAAKGVWILLNHQGANENQLNFSCGRAGQLVNVLSTGNNTVLLRYADTNGEPIAQKLKNDFQGNDRVKIVTDEEVEKMLKNRPAGNGWAPNGDAQWSNGGTPVPTGECANSQTVFSNQDDLNRPPY